MKKKKKNSKNQIHLYIISFYQYASPYYMNVFFGGLGWRTKPLKFATFLSNFQETGAKIVM